MKPAGDSNKPGSGFFIGVGCPGCGGDLELDDDFFVISCKYCGSVLRVLKPDTPVAYLVQSTLDGTTARFYLDRYLKKRGDPLTGSQLMYKRLYYPYWKVDGYLLKLRNKTERRVVTSEYDADCETTVESDKTSVSVTPYSMSVGAGASMPSIPDSLGIRSEHIRILPFSRENVQDGFDTINVTRSQEEVAKSVGLAVATIGEMAEADFGTNVTKLYDPVFSMVYFPYLLVESYDPEYRRFAMDGLSGRVIGHLDADGTQLAARHAVDASGYSHAGGAAAYRPGLGGIRNGSDVVANARYQGVSDDFVEVGAAERSEPLNIEFGELDVDFHRCSNCGIDLPSDMSYVYVCKNCHTPRLLHANRFELTNIEQVDTPVDHETHLVPFWAFKLPPDQMARLGVLLGGLGRPERLLVPALRSRNFEAIQRLAKRMTSAGKRLPTRVITELHERCLSVRVGLNEAVAQAEMIVVKELLKLGKRADQAEIEFNPTEIGLLYVPFKLQNYFFTDTALGAVSMERMLLPDVGE
ncbi:hypothetical protein GF377_08510 [candidate division GN15 bacterium]|nr:hypothetical protein [candidate division GN15 bacterium]